MLFFAVCHSRGYHSQREDEAVLHSQLARCRYGVLHQHAQQRRLPLRDQQT